MRDVYAGAPTPSYRLVPSKFPPIGLFDTVATAADLRPVMELVGWTNDRLIPERLNRLPENEWVYGSHNSSVVMAAFLHAPVSGMRFNGPDLGAWYASDTVPAAVVEVAHHLRREAVASGIAQIQRKYRAYSSTLAGSYLDIRSQQKSRPGAYDPEDYTASQALGESIRASGEAGLIFDSLRYASGTNAVAYRPRNILNVVQANHYEISVLAGDSRIEAKRLAT